MNKKSSSSRKIMVNQLLINDIDNCDVPDVNLLVTEDDTPVDNLASAKQQRLLVGSLTVL